MHPAQQAGRGHGQRGAAAQVGRRARHAQHQPGVIQLEPVLRHAGGHDAQPHQQRHPQPHQRQEAHQLVELRQVARHLVAQRLRRLVLRRQVQPHLGHAIAQPGIARAQQRMRRQQPGQPLVDQLVLVSPAVAGVGLFTGQRASRGRIPRTWPGRYPAGVPAPAPDRPTGGSACRCGRSAPRRCRDPVAPTEMRAAMRRGRHGCRGDVRCQVPATAAP